MIPCVVDGIPVHSHFSEAEPLLFFWKKWFNQLPDMVHNLVFGMEHLPILVQQDEGKSQLADLLQRALVEPIIGCRDPTP
eukprot:12612074-Alexandrium_andersonii.AAC.1